MKIGLRQNRPAQIIKFTTKNLLLQGKINHRKSSVLMEAGSNSANESTMMAPINDTIMKSPYDTDVVRLIGQYLVNVGLMRTANLLLEESGLRQIDHPIPVKFKEHILAGDWDKANRLVQDVASLTIPVAMEFSSNPGVSNSLQATNKNQLNGSNSTSTTNASSNSDLKRQLSSTIVGIRLAIAEQKFLELVDDSDRIRALRCLRCEVTPLCKDVKRIQFLTTLLMCKSSEEIRLRANWSGKGSQTRQALFDKITRYIPAPLMLPPKRLETLLNQAVQLQRDRCVLHQRRPPIAHRSSASSLTRPTSTIPNLPSGQPAQLIKKSSVATIISERDHLGCGGVCNLLERHQQKRQQQQLFPSLEYMEINMLSPFDIVNSSSSGIKAIVDTQYSHNERDDHPIDLKTDHVCSAEKFPLIAKQELDSHNSEVWFCEFSNDGTKLATGGLGGKIKIWHLNSDCGRELVEKCTLDCNSYSISCLSWSPDDAYLIACGSEDQPDLWIWNVNTEQMHQMIDRVDDESFTTCSWHRSGERFAAASIKGTFKIFDLNGNRCGSREGVRVQCLSFLNEDPGMLLAADTLNRIRAYEVKCDNSTELLSLKTEEDDVLEERHSIMSFVIDHEDKYIAVNLMEQGVHLWDFRRRTLLRIFLGVTQRNLTVYSSFSSPDSTFLASGSEDGKIYIYHIEKDQPVAILSGHTRCVNCVSWNRRFPELLASVSDDHTVRLWAPVDPHKSYNICPSLIYGQLAPFI